MDAVDPAVLRRAVPPDPRSLESRPRDTGGIENNMRLVQRSHADAVYSSRVGCLRHCRMQDCGADGRDCRATAAVVFTLILPPILRGFDRRSLWTGDLVGSCARIRQRIPAGQLMISALERVVHRRPTLSIGKPRGPHCQGFGISYRSLCRSKLTRRNASWNHDFQSTSAVGPSTA